MSYSLLIFEPDIVNRPLPENVLWKAQVIHPDNFKSISLVLLKDLIEENDRRSLNQWQDILKDNGFTYELNYDHEYCIEYIIFEEPCIVYSFQLFKCDLQENNKIEVSADYIIPLFLSLDVKLNQSYNATAFLNKLTRAKQMIQEKKAEPFLLKNIILLSKLADLCIDHEVNVKISLQD